MVIVQAGSGQRDRQEEVLSPWEEKGKGKNGERWACGRLVQGQAGERGPILRGPLQSGSSELGGASVT